MPIEFTFIEPLNLIHRVFSGPITLDEMRKEFEARYSHPDYRPGMAEVVDLTAAKDPAVPFEELLDYVNSVAKFHFKRGDVIQLFLVGNTQEIDAAVEMYENLVAATDMPMDVHVVRGYPEVLALLDLPPESLRHFPENCRSEQHLL